MDQVAVQEEEEELEPERCNVCASCLEVIEANTTCYDLNYVRLRMIDSIVRPTLILEDGSEVPLEPNVDNGEPTAHTDPAVEPLHFHEVCWDAIAEQLNEFCANIPPVEDDVPIVECDMCGSSIRLGEESSRLRFGRMKLSKRGDGSDHFSTLEGAYDFCLTCAMGVADLTECDWWSTLSQNGECYHCTAARCWRKGRCTCVCHTDKKEEA